MECTETTTRRQSDCHTVLSRHKRAAANTRTVEVVVTVGDVLGVPAVGSVPREHVLSERQMRLAVDRDVVVVVQDDEATQAQVARQRRRLRTDTLLQTAVA